MPMRRHVRRLNKGAPPRRRAPRGAVPPGSPRDGRWVLASQEDAEVRLPRADLGVVRPRHAREDLADVVEVVDRPRREQLAERDLPEGRVQATAIEVAFDGDLLQPREVLRPEA